MPRTDKPVDAFILHGQRGGEDQQGTRHPSRLEPKTVTVGTTQTSRRMCVRATVLHNTAPLINNTVGGVNISFTGADTFDTVGLHDEVSNPTQIVIPTTGMVSGLWLLHGRLCWNDTGGGTRRIARIELSSGTILAQTQQPPAAAAGLLTQDVILYVLDPNPGTAYVLNASQDSAGNLALFEDSTVDGKYNYFEAIHVW